MLGGQDTGDPDGTGYLMLLKTRSLRQVILRRHTSAHGGSVSGRWWWSCDPQWYPGRFSIRRWHCFALVVAPVFSPSGRWWWWCSGPLVLVLQGVRTEGAALPPVPGLTQHDAHYLRNSTEATTLRRQSQVIGRGGVNLMSLGIATVVHLLL